MLISLNIRNIVLIDEIDLTFKNGLIVFTGETGAGKSILLEGLGLSLGTRAKFELIGKKSNNASVTAQFNFEKNHSVFKIIEQQGIYSDQSIILKRIISSDGKSRALINGEPVAVNVLNKVGREIIEIQGQFDNHSLLDPKNHMLILDNFGNHNNLKNQTSFNFNNMLKAKKKLSDHLENLSRIKIRKEELQELIHILEKLDPKKSEEEDLVLKRSLISESAKYIEAINYVNESLEGENSIRKTIYNLLAKLERVDNQNSKLKSAIDALKRASNEIEEVSLIMSSISSSIDSNPDKLNEIDERLHEIRNVSRRLNIQPNSLLDYYKDSIEEFSKIDNKNVETDFIANDLKKKEKEYKLSAYKLSALRIESSKILDNLIEKELPDLKLDQAYFKTNITELSEEMWSENGLDNVFFKVITNPDQEFLSLDKVASGGELSRFLLAIKVVTAEKKAAKTLIFDEVDSGIGGPTAAAVGQRLKRLSESNQVIVITHSPQVAAIGKYHYFIEKSIFNKNSQTKCSSITGNERVEEISRMLSGKIITNEAREAAKSLLIKENENK